MLNQRFIEEALQAHNILRARHGAAPLVHNYQLSNIAQNYANYLASTRILRHSKNSYLNESLGENLGFFHITGVRYPHHSGEQVSVDWYNEIKDHRFGEFQHETGHFTQMVWKGTKEVGFGIAKSRKGEFFYVANYYPAGNVIGSFANNVSPQLY